MTAAIIENDTAQAILSLRQSVEELDSLLESKGMTKQERAAAVSGAVGRIIVGEE